MAELIILTGPPGAGKSVVARALVAQFEPAALVAGDGFFAFLGRGAVAPWLPEAWAQNEVMLAASAAAAGQMVAGGYTVVYDGVVGPWSLDAFIAATGLDEVHYVVLMPSLERCVQRVGGRHGTAGLEATRYMYDDFAESDVDPRHVLSELTDEPAETVSLVLERLVAGEVAHRTAARALAVAG